MTINEELNAMADNHMVEPIDEPECHPMDYADVVGIFDEIYTEPMVDDSGIFWYTH